jgi:hypothetical protein
MTYDDSTPPDESPLDESALEAARHYHTPPSAVPRDAMWSAIQAARSSRPMGEALGPIGQVSPRSPARRVLPWRTSWPVAVAAAIVLAAGVAIGRWSLGTSNPTNVTADAGSAARGDRPATSAADGVAYSVAVARDLTQAEALLTAFRTEREPSRDAQANAELARWARDVLSNTRLLIDSPAAADPQRRHLLEDLELVLVQMVELAPDRTGAERQMIDSTLAHDHVLSRLRYAVPAGPTGI